jgi:hypothetical protein
VPHLFELARLFPELAYVPGIRLLISQAQLYFWHQLNLFPCSLVFLAAAQSRPLLAQLQLVSVIKRNAAGVTGNNRK